MARTPGVTGSSSHSILFRLPPLNRTNAPEPRGCVTPKQFVNIREKLTSSNGTLDITTLDGYDKLSEDLQEKVKEAIEQGHVADSDWKGVSTPHPEKQLSGELTCFPGRGREPSWRAIKAQEEHLFEGQSR